jgi:hypothetical protein
MLSRDVPQGAGAVEWLATYGPRQLRDVLGLAEWQYARAAAAGTVPPPDVPGGKWSADVVRVLYARRAAIRRNAGGVPDLGAERAAEVLAGRLGIDVEPHAVHELAHQGQILAVDDYKGHPLYCGRTLETWSDREQVELANTAGERLTVDRAVDRLGVRRSDFDQLVALGWIAPAAWGRGPFTAQKRRPDVPLYRAGDVTALLTDPVVDWDAVRAVRKGQRSLLAALPPRESHPNLKGST